MNSRITYYILFYFICFVINFDNVFGLTCKYNTSGYSNDDIFATVTITPTTADVTTHGTDDEYKIKNWLKGSEDYWNGKVSYEASKEFTSTCPPYLYHRYVVGEWSTYYLINSSSATYWEEQLTPFMGAFDKYMYVDENDDTDYDDTLTCSYEVFTITYTKDGKAISIEKNDDYDFEAYYNDVVELSSKLQSMYDNWNGSCPTVCYTKNRDECPTLAKTCFDRYTVYYSAADTNNQSCEVLNCIAGTANCVADESGNTYNGICDGYDKYMKEIEGLYESYSNCGSNNGCKGEKIKQANQSIEKLDSFCQSVYKIAYFSDPCVKECTKMEPTLSNLKTTYKISKIENNGTASCSLSERMVGWIFKIVQWIRYLVPILLILLSVLDFIKAIASNSEDEIRKVGAKFVKRLIVSALIFILPLILEFLLGIFNIDTYDYCLK